MTRGEMKRLTRATVKWLIKRGENKVDMGKKGKDEAESDKVDRRRE